MTVYYVASFDHLLASLFRNDQKISISVGACSSARCWLLETYLTGRVLAGCFWFCILIWISTYTANLAAFFTVRNSERQINTLEDVVEGDYPFYVMRDSAIHQFFRVAEYHTYRKLWERMNAANTFVNSTAEGYGMTRKVENAVFMAEKPSTEYVIMQKPCDLRTGKKTLVSKFKHFNPTYTKRTRTIMAWLQYTVVKEKV